MSSGADGRSISPMTRGFGALLDDDEVVDGGRPQADALGRERLRHPVVAAAGLHEHALLGEQVEQVARQRPEVLAAVPPAPERRASSSSNGSSNAAHLMWLMRTSRLSGSTSPASGDVVEQVLGVRRRRTGSAATTTRRAQANASPCRRPARPICCQALASVPGIAGEHRRIEPADVDAKLERVRGDDAADAAVAQAALDGAALVRQIAAAVALDLVLRLADAPVASAPRAGSAAAARRAPATARRRSSARRRAAAARRSCARRRRRSRRMPSSRFTTGGL